MEKYFVILILIVISYSLYNCWVDNKIEKILKTKEGFAETLTKSDSDLFQSITTLGQIADKLQGSNGLTVPGKMNCIGGVNVTGILAVNNRDIVAELDNLRNTMTNITNGLRNDTNGLRNDTNGLRNDVNNLINVTNDIKNRAIFNGDKMVLHPNGKPKNECSDIGRTHTCNSNDGNAWSLATIEKK